MIITIILAIALLIVIVVAVAVVRSQAVAMRQKSEQAVRLDVALAQQNVVAAECAARESMAMKSVAELRESAQVGEQTIRKLIEERAAALKEVEAMAEQLKAERERVGKLQETLRDEFKNLASEIMEQKGRQFKQANKEEMEIIIKPLRDNIVDFKVRVEQIYSDENQQRGALKNELRNLLDLNKRITEETTHLTNALKGNSKVQGDWGEMILETILDSSSLVGGIHYTTQSSYTDAEGNRLRPDVVLNLPDNKQVVIDSKVSLTAFVSYANAETHELRAPALADHLASIKRHVDELGSKRYQNLVDSPDFVIMFVPNEPAFLAALQGDPTIWSTAYNKKVIISSPTNLFALLKIVDDLWKRDSQSKNALEIARQGADLYDKFVGLLDSVSLLGVNIEKAAQSYDKVLRQLKSGSGNLIGRTERLRKLGLKSQKSLPAQFDDFDDEQEDSDDEA